MNWFKKAQRQLSYVDIGHGSVTEDASDYDNYLWYFDGSRIHVAAENVPGELWRTHIVVFGEDQSKDKYSGRFDKINKQVSVSIPPKFKFVELPSVLIKRLHEKFGNDISLHYFNQ